MSAGAPAAQSLAYLHELVVVDPDQVARSRGLFDSIRKLAIDALVEFPIPRIEVAARLQIVKERPNDFVGEALIIVALLLLGQKERRVFIGTISARLFKNLADLRGVFRSPRTDPDASVILKQRFQCTDQPTAAGHPRELSTLGGERNGNAVGNQHQI